MSRAAERERKLNLKPLERGKEKLTRHELSLTAEILKDSGAGTQVSLYFLCFLAAWLVGSWVQPSGVKESSPNHWITREFSTSYL